ncbi:MAG: DUF2497 domain-containing protein [Alphaproteobacteria bacterium]|nr:DUF2497 domain-containing protein [Alphaproteobacteria bacterium]
MNIAAPNPIPSSRNAADRQQETTMDEILASIRRIITEDQASAPAPVETKAQVRQDNRQHIDNRQDSDHRYDTSGPMAGRTAEDIGSAVERLRRALDPNMSKSAQMRAPDPHSFEPEAEAHHQPYGQAAYAAPRSGDAVAARQEAIQPMQGRPSFDPVDEDFSAAGRSLSQPPLPPQAFERGRPQPQPQVSFAKARAQRTAETRSAELRPSAHGAGEPVAPSAADTANGLLSSQANASVAASFEALNKTLLTQNQETMESLARELMQPLLKQWLDDNLPTLVEKLVRAEIERVARGGRG